MQYNQISLTELVATINKTQNWKAPGNNYIHNYWLKKFTSTHKDLTKYLNGFIVEPHTMPQFLCNGITYLLPKNNDTQNPANYRPITCLPTI